MLAGMNKRSPLFALAAAEFAAHAQAGARRTFGARAVVNNGALGRPV